MTIEYEVLWLKGRLKELADVLNNKMMPVFAHEAARDEYKHVENIIRILEDTKAIKDLTK